MTNRDKVRLLRDWLTYARNGDADTVRNVRAMVRQVYACHKLYKAADIYPHRQMARWSDNQCVLWELLELEATPRS